MADVGLSIGIIMRGRLVVGGGRSFDEVYFERVPFPSFTGPNIEALSEVARLLYLGGQLVLESGIAAPVDEIVARLRAAGFIGIDVARLGLLRVTAMLGET